MPGVTIDLDGYDKPGITVDLVESNNQETTDSTLAKKRSSNVDLDLVQHRMDFAYAQRVANVSYARAENGEMVFAVDDENLLGVLEQLHLPTMGEDIDELFAQAGSSTVMLTHLSEAKFARVTNADENSS